MKKLTLLLFAAAVLALLAGCGAKKQAEVPPADSSKAAPPPAVSQEELPPPEPPEEIILYTVTSTTQEETLLAEDGTKLLTSRFQLPVLTAHRQDGTVITEAKTEKEAAALAAAETFNRKFTDWTTAEELQDMADIAAQDYAWRKQEQLDWLEGYSIELSCTAYQTRNMISVSGMYYSYTGGAHPNGVYLGWNFDLENGAFFGPEVLGDGTALQDAVTDELIEQCGTRVEDATKEGVSWDMFWPDYETILADWASYAVTFDETGMTITFSPYELAAYAAGPQSFEISYEFLEPYLSLQGLSLLGLAEEPGA